MVQCSGTLKCRKNSDCVSGVCNQADLRCKEIQIDTEKAVEIALKMQNKHAKTLGEPDIEDKYLKPSNPNATSNETVTEGVVDEIVEVENNVANTTKQVSQLHSNVDKVLVEITKSEQKDLEKEKKVNATLQKLTNSLKLQNSELGGGGGFGNELEDNGRSFSSNATESIKEEVEETKSFLKDLIDEEKKDRNKEVEALKEMKVKLQKLSEKMNKTTSELKGVRKSNTQKDKALETLGRDKIKEDAIKEIESQIQSGAKVDYESGALENKNGKELPSSITDKIKRLDTKSRHRVEKAREDAFRKAADPAIMVTDMTLLLDVTIMLSFAAFGGFLSKLFRLPVTFGYIMGGLIVGPSSLEFVSNVGQVQTLAQFGSMFMIFGLGVEYPTEQVEYVRNICIRGGIFTIIAVALVFSFILTFSRKEMKSLIAPILLGCGLAMSSTTVVLAHLRGVGGRETNSDSNVAGDNRVGTNRRFSSLYAQITLGMIAVHEFWMALILSLPELLHSQDLIFSSSRIVLGAAVAYTLIKITPLSVFNRMLYFVANQDESSELFKLGIVSFCLVFSLITYSCGLSLELGAFISGYLLSRSPHRSRALSVVEPLKSLFSIIFFASMGMTLNMHFLISNARFLILGAVLFMLIKSTVIALVLYYCFELPMVSAFAVGIVLGSIGELSLVFVSKTAKMSWKGSLVKMISRRHYLLYLGLSVVVLLISPVLHKILPYKWITLMETQAANKFLEKINPAGESRHDIELAPTQKNSSYEHKKKTPHRVKDHNSDGD
eukprot:g237.t1